MRHGVVPVQLQSLPELVWEIRDEISLLELCMVNSHKIHQKVPEHANIDVYINKTCMDHLL